MRVTCPSCKNDFVVSEFQLATGSRTTAGCPTCGSEYQVDMSDSGQPNISFGQRKLENKRICIECTKEFSGGENEAIPICPDCKRLLKNANDSLQLKSGSWKLSKNGKLIALDSVEMVRDWISQGAIHPDDRLIDPAGKEHFAKRVDTFATDFQLQREKQKQQVKPTEKSFKLPSFQKIGNRLALALLLFVFSYFVLKIIRFSPTGPEWSQDLNHFIKELKSRVEPSAIPAQELTRQALILMSKDRMESYQQAIGLLEQSLISNKNSVETLTALAESYALFGGHLEEPQFRLAATSLANLAIQLFPDRVEAYTAQIRAALANHDEPLAKQDIEKAKNLNDSSERFSLAVASYWNETATSFPPEELFQSAKGALTQNPDFLEAYSLMGQAWLKRSNPLRAKEMFETRLRRSESDPLALFQLGKIEERAGNFSSAKEWFQNALRVSPSYTPARFELAQIYLRYDKEIAIAEHHFRNLLGKFRKLSSTETIYFSELALIDLALKANRPSEAADLVSHLPVDYLTDPLTYVAKAKSLVASARLPDAVNLLKEGNNLNDFFISELLAETIEASGNIDEAAKFYREAIKLSPHTFLPYIRSVLMLLKRDRSQEALDIANTAVNRSYLLDPPHSSWTPFVSDLDWDALLPGLEKWGQLQNQDAVVQSFLGMVYLFRGIQESKKSEIQKSIRSLERAVGLNRNAEFSLILLGRAKAALKYWDEALGHFQVALKLNPASNVSRMWLAKSKKELKQYEDAKQTLTSFISDPDWGAWVLYELGEIALAQNQLKEARNFFETSLQKDPLFTPAWKKLLSTKWT